MLFHLNAAGVLEILFVISFQHHQVDGLVSTEHISGADTEEERIADLTGCSGNDDFDGFLHLENLLK